MRMRPGVGQFKQLFRGSRSSLHLDSHSGAHDDQHGAAWSNEAYLEVAFVVDAPAITSREAPEPSQTPSTRRCVPSGIGTRIIGPKATRDAGGNADGHRGRWRAGIESCRSSTGVEVSRRSAKECQEMRPGSGQLRLPRPMDC